jgi:hypothetical protein
MFIYTHKVVDGFDVALTQEEIAELQARDAAYIPPTKPAPTKEELLAELQALTAKIQALE